jgi:hypothetical protein
MGTWILAGYTVAGEAERYVENRRGRETGPVKSPVPVSVVVISSVGNLLGGDVGSYGSWPV